MNRPWMPLYVADYLADTAHLNACQSGAYLHLIMHYWQTGGLPTDDKSLARIARMSRYEWLKNKATISEFFSHEWRQKRIDKEIAHAQHVSDKRRESVKQRYNNRNTIVEQMNTHSHSHLERKKEEVVSKAKKPSRLAEPLAADWKPDKAFAKARGFSEAEIDVEEARFRDYAAANRRLQVDWDASWRNWVTSPFQRHRSANGQGSGGVPRPGSREDRAERTANAYAKLAEYTAARADDARSGGKPGPPPAGLLPFDEPSRS